MYCHTGRWRDVKEGEHRSRGCGAEYQSAGLSWDDTVNRVLLVYVSKVPNARILLVLDEGDLCI